VDLSKYKEVILYSRFSSALQSSGTSEVRQDDAGTAFAAEHNIALSSRRIDRAKSGSKGSNLEEGGALRQIIDGIADGTIATPCLLLIERQDRYGRLAPTKALTTLFGDLLEQGCDLFHIQKRKLYSAASINADFGDLVTLAAEVHAAHQYAVQLSERSLVAHQKAREKLLRGDPGVRPNWAPAWIDWDLATQQWSLNAYADVVRRLLELAESGLGQIRIAGELNQAGLLTPRGKAWSAGSVGHILYSPSVCGGREIRRRSGQIVWDTFPEVVSRARWEAIKSAVAARDNAAGRHGPQGTMLWLGQAVTFCSCGQIVGHRSASCVVKGERVSHSYLRCRGRIKLKGRTASCDQPALRLAAVQAHVLTRLAIGQWRELFPSVGDDQLQQLHAQARIARQGLAEAAAMLRVAEAELQRSTAEEPRLVSIMARAVAAAEDAVEQAERKHLAAVGAVEQAESNQVLRSVSELHRTVQEHLKVFADGADKPEERQAINVLLRSLGIRIVIDAGAELVALHIGDGPAQWQPLAAAGRAVALEQGLVDPSVHERADGTVQVVDWDAGRGWDTSDIDA
jgi:hypothetical protein